METHSQVIDSQRSKHILEGQLRECFVRVVYSHKTHEKCADMLAICLSRVTLSQISLSAIVTGSLIFRLIGFGNLATIMGIILSAVLLCLNLYMKDRNLNDVIHKHKKAANEIWLIRERYQSLLTDLLMENKTLDSILDERDTLMKELHLVYSAAPSTNSRAYRNAQKALKQDEDMTFSDKEIDAFLPQELKRSDQATTHDGTN